MRPLFFIFAVLTALPSLYAQSAKALGKTPVTVRAVKHDPINALSEVYLMGEKSEPMEILFRKSNISKPQKALALGGVLNLYKTKSFSPENPGADVAHAITLPEGVTEVLLVVIPVRIGSSYEPRAILIDDAKFAGGEARIINLMRFDCALKVGEHLVEIKPGKVSLVPGVEERNEYNMAQTNFYSKRDGTWSVLSERQVKYTDRIRRLYVICPIPGADRPRITTIVDTLPARRG